MDYNPPTVRPVEELDPRVLRIVRSTPSLAPIVRLHQQRVVDEREAMIQLLIQLARDNERLKSDLQLLGELQPATLPMGRRDR